MVYEYECRRCQSLEEFNMSVEEYETFMEVCSKCGSMDLRRRWSAPSIHVEHAE